MTDPRMAINNYYDRRRVAAAVARGDHRQYVGGLWEAVGQLQFDFLLGRGLRPDMRLLDIGCGCLRGGVHFVRHLEPGGYFGVDLSQDLLDAGYDIELAAADLQDRLPRENLLCDGEFRFDRLDTTFDVAIAQSVFTHLPLNHIRLCLARLVPVMKVGATLYATFFRVPDGAHWATPAPRVDGSITTRFEQDPFHYRYEDLDYCASELPWRLEPIGDWAHPRGQEMVALTRIAE